jgi:hypothetical protein
VFADDAGDDGGAVADGASVDSTAIRDSAPGGLAQGGELILHLLHVSVGDPEVVGFDGGGSANRSDCG